MIPPELVSQWRLFLKKSQKVSATWAEREKTHRKSRASETAEAPKARGEDSEEQSWLGNRGYPHSLSSRRVTTHCMSWLCPETSSRWTPFMAGVSSRRSAFLSLLLTASPLWNLFYWTSCKSPKSNFHQNQNSREGISPDSRTKPPGWKKSSVPCQPCDRTRYLDGLFFWPQFHYP